MHPAETRERTKRRHRARLGLLRRRAAVASVLGFAAFAGLAAQHAVGSSKRRAAVVVRNVRAAVPAVYFDQRADGFAFDDGSVAQSATEGAGSAAPSQSPDSGSTVASAPPPPPPVAQTSVS